MRVRKKKLSSDDMKKSGHLEAIVNAMPGSVDKRDASREMIEVLNRISARRMPVGALIRFMGLGSMQMKITFAYLFAWLRGGLVREGEKERIVNEAHLSVALKVFYTMGYMRGAVMKIGQVLANLPKVVPDEFAEVLGSLHFEAPPMHYSMVREVFKAEMGCEPEELFEYFDRKAFAAASLGQVHRASLKTGEEVAVKIQYPHIGQTIRSDLRNLRLLMAPMRFSADWDYLADLIQEVEGVLTMETDYLQEAEFYRQAKELFQGEEKIVIPEVHDSYCTKRILTMEYLSGCHLKEFLDSDPSQSKRDHYTELLTKVWARLFYSGSRLFADPNPGNFIFMENEKIGVIDFGCTRQLSSGERQLLGEMEDACLKNDMERLDQSIAQATLYGAPESMDQEQLNVIRRSSVWSHEPLRRKGVFDWGDEEFFRQGVELFIETMRKRCMRSIPLCFWSTRLIYGFRALCYRLKGRVRFAEICDRERELGRRS